jgi:hypothetical protein
MDKDAPGKRRCLRAEIVDYVGCVKKLFLTEVAGTYLAVPTPGSCVPSCGLRGQRGAFELDLKPELEALRWAGSTVHPARAGPSLP